MIIKRVHRCGGRAHVELLVSSLKSDMKMHSAFVPFLGLEGADLESVMQESGADCISVFGGHQNQAVDRHKSIDLILVAEKQAAIGGEACPTHSSIAFLKGSIRNGYYCGFWPM